MKFKHQNLMEKEKYMPGQMSWYECQWHVSEKARANDRAGEAPSVLGTWTADTVFKEAVMFLLTKGITVREEVASARGEKTVEPGHGKVRHGGKTRRDS